MAGSVNRVILVGRLGAAPKIRTPQGSDKKIASFSLATSETWRDRNTGERKERTEWHRVVVLNDGLAKVAEQFLKKGSLVYVEGANQTRSYATDDGDRYVTEVVLGPFNSVLTMMESRGDRAPDADETSYGRDTADRIPDRMSEILDDEIPF